MSEFDNREGYDPLKDMGALDEANRIQELESDKKKKIKEAEKVAERIAVGEEVAPEAMESFNATKEELLSEPVIEESKTEPISAEDIAVAAKVLGEEQKMVLPEEKLTEAEQQRLSAFRVTADKNNQMPTPEAEDAERAKIIAERGEKKTDTTEGVVEDEKVEAPEKENEGPPEIIDAEFVEVKDEKKEEAKKDDDNTKGKETKKKKSEGKNADEKSKIDGKLISESQARDRMEKIEEYKDPRLKARLYRTLAEALAKQGAKSDLVNEIMDKSNEYTSGGEKLTKEEQDRVIDYCYKQIFEMGEKSAYNAEAVIRSLVNPDGFIVTELGKSRGNIDRDTLNIIKELGLDNWIGVRETLRSWDKLRNTEEVTGGSLNEGLFTSDYVEKFFAGIVQPDGSILPRKMKVPEIKEGKLVIEDIPDIEVAVSKAMVDLRKFFEGKEPITLKSGRVITGGGVDHYNIIQSREQREQIYDMLEINKHVAEVAFTELTSHLMLTEFSADDIFLMMVDRTKKEIKLYNIMGNKSPAVRTAVHSLQTAGWSHDRLFTENRKLTPEVQTVIENWLSHSLPRHLIPTGMTGMEAAFNEGHWLRERVLHLKTGAQRSTEVAALKKVYLEGRAENDLSEAEKTQLSRAIMNLDKASDTDTRLEMMKRALTVLTGIKDVTAKPESGLAELGKLKASLLIHYKVNLKSAGWVNNDMTCDPYFDFVSDGTRPVKEGEWASTAMVAVAKIDMFTKSYADGYCEKPKDMNSLAEMAAQILSQLPQTEEEAYLGFEKSVRVKHRKEFADYFTNLWRDNMTLVNQLKLGNQYWNLLSSAFSPRTETVKFPDWYNFGVPPKPEILQMMAKDVNSTAWPDRLRNIDLSR